MQTVLLWARKFSVQLWSKDFTVWWKSIINRFKCSWRHISSRTFVLLLLLAGMKGREEGVCVQNSFSLGLTISRASTNYNPRKPLSFYSLSRYLLYSNNNMYPPLCVSHNCVVLPYAFLLLCPSSGLFYRDRHKNDKQTYALTFFSLSNPIQIMNAH